MRGTLLVILLVAGCIVSGRASEALTFSPVSYPVGSRPTSVAVSDVNNDGVPDIIAMNAGDGTASVIASSPAAPEIVDISNRPTAIAAGDLDGDADVDLASVSAANGSIRFRFGDGTGAFPSGANYETASSKLSIVAIADVNDDARSDVITDVPSGGVRVLRGKGAGGFAPATGSPYDTKEVVTSLVVGDLDGDRWKDVVLTSVSAGSVTVLRGSSTGALSVGTRRLVDGASNVALADFDRDGRTDVAVTKQTSPEISVFLGDGAGNLNDAPDGRLPACVGARSITTGDMNDDAIRDIVVACDMYDEISVLLGDGSGGFRRAAGSPFAIGGSPQSILASDVDGNGLDELVVARAAMNDVAIVDNTSTRSIRTSATSIDFGGQETGSVSSAHTVSVSSAGLATTITDVAIEGSNAFAIASDNCTGRTVGDGYASCDIAVTFAPPATGAFDSTLHIDSATVALSGGGIDTTPPDTVITSSPQERTSDNPVVFAFSSNEPGSIFECRVDADEFGACDSPYAAESLAPGDHTFDVRAIDAAGNVDPSPASSRFTVVFEPVAAPPETTIVEHPPALTNETTPTFRFISDQPVAAFECSLDDAASAPCGSPHTTEPLSEGDHSFAVAALDAAGNADPTPDEFSFTIDMTKPDTTITGRSRVHRRHALYTLRFSEDVQSVMCSVDGSGYSQCKTPFNARNLRRGRHVLRAWAVDAAGNVEEVPAKKVFRIL